MLKIYNGLSKWVNPESSKVGFYDGMHLGLVGSKNQHILRSSL